MSNVTEKCGTCKGDKMVRRYDGTMIFCPACGGKGWNYVFGTGAWTSYVFIGTTHTLYGGLTWA